MRHTVREKVIIEALRDGWELRTFGIFAELIKPLQNRRRAHRDSVDSLLNKGRIVVVREVGDQRIYKLTTTFVEV